MSDTFLSKFLSVAKQITRAERGMAVDADLEIVALLDLDTDAVNDPSFSQFAEIWLRRALETDETIITNNIITDATKAPNTNTNFSNLRVVVVIPVRDHGAVYLDQHIRHGIIPRDTIERLTQMINSVQQDKNEHLSEGEMIEIYEKLS
jgi:hypothetical protein